MTTEAAYSVRKYAPPQNQILGRPERNIPYHLPLEKLQSERVLVTGAHGSLGAELGPLLMRAGVDVLATDVHDMDVRDWFAVGKTVKLFRPTVIVHLAGAKQAPDGELEPERVTETNVGGTANIVQYAAAAKVVLASTCKACEAETVYGASKLIAERLVLNSGGSVARFYNVADTAGNVFEFWRSVDGPLPVTPCHRYFVTAREAVGLLLWAAVLPAGRYTLDPGEARYMPDVAHSLYPGRPFQHIRPRRGDRHDELLCARSEKLEAVRECSALRKIVGRHDEAQTDDEIWAEWWSKSRAA